MKLGRIEIVGAVILLVMVILLFTVRFSTAPGGEPLRPEGAELLDAVAGDNYAMTAAELTSLGENIQMIDLRDAEAFAGGHPEGAMNLRLRDVFDPFKALCSESGKGVLFYDATGAEGQAAQAALLYRLNGCSASWLKGGYAAIP